MNDPNDPNMTADLPASAVPPDSLDAGLAAGFGRPAAPRSSLGDLRPVLLKEAEDESAHLVKPKSDALPSPEIAGDRYQLQGEIARGGMGAVLRARDTDLGRDLALKVLLPRFARRPDVARRFVEEAQIGGQLQHPGVVPVYDIGRFGDRPFFTMKLVKGHTLAALLAERADPSADRPRFLAVALQVAQTLAYAHAKGVIHRDLKPANVMVGGFGEVQVMDWGLAKVLPEGGLADEERASRAHGQPQDVTTIRTARSSGSAGSFGTDTEAGSLLGTPAYMPPEQANGDMALLDRRADVFGLGAILCEVLTGQPPYVGRSAEEVRRKAANGDQADATARLDACGADHDLVSLTKACLAPEPADRPRDAQGVADGLRAYLDGVQDKLRQAELAEAQARARAVEEARRRRLTLALAGTVLLALTLGGGGWLWVKADRDARQAAVTREVNDALNQAVALKAQAAATPAGGAVLFGQAREQVQRASALVAGGPADPALRDQVARAQAELDDEDRDRRLVAALDDARLRQAETVAGEGRFASEQAVPLFREAFRSYGLPPGQGDPKEVAERIRARPAAVRDAILAALDEWDALADMSGVGTDESHRAWLRAVLKAAEPDDGWTRRFRAARDDKDPARRRAALEALAAAPDVGMLPARALTRLAGPLTRAGAGPAAARLLRRARQQYPADFWVNQDLGTLLQWVRPPEREEAVRFLTAAAALKPDSPGALINLGIALYENRQPDEAIACYNKALALDPKYAEAHNNLGLALADKGQIDDAIACYNKALELKPKHPAVHTNVGLALAQKGQIDDAIACYTTALQLAPRNAKAHNNLGVALAQKGQIDDAIASFKTALVLDPKYAQAHANMGNTLLNRGQIDDAIAAFNNALQFDPKDAKAHTILGAALEKKGQLDDAIACYHKALQLDPQDAKAHRILGAALVNKGRLDDAIASYNKALALDPKDVMTHNNLGIALAEKGRLEDAIASFNKALQLDPKDARAHCNLGAASLAKGQIDDAIASYNKALALEPRFAHAHYNLGVVLAGKGQTDDAIASYKRALELDPKYAKAHNNLGNALAQKGQFDDAIACYKKALELDPKYALARTNLASAERMALARDRLPGFRNGTYTPPDNPARLGLAEWCLVKDLPHTAARLYADAFAADPTLADDLTQQPRYGAACAAALAAAGKGEDAANLDDKERARLCRQALGWLRADLAGWARLLDTGPPAERRRLIQTLNHWQKDADLAAVRDPAALEKLPADERAACAQLWTDVASLLKKAVAPANKEGQP